MRIGFLADVHVGNPRRMGGEYQAGLNRRCSEILYSLQLALSRAREMGCSYVVSLGDLFDVSHPPPQVIAAVQRAIGDTKFIALLGNHEQDSTADGDNALGPLEPVSTVIERPQILHLSDPMGSGGVELWAVPFRPGRASDWLPKVLAELEDGAEERSPASAPRILALHLGISDNSTPPWLKDAHDSINVSDLIPLALKYGFAGAFCGNWHEYRDWNAEGVAVVQCSALAPTGFDNPGLDHYGKLVVLDAQTNRVKVGEIPGPRFVKLRWPLENADERWRLNKTYLEVSALPEDAAHARAYIDGLVKAGDVVDGEVVLDGAEDKAAARTAATVARSAETLDEALSSFVREMPLPDGVNRDAVLSRAKGYLGGAA